MTSIALLGDSTFDNKAYAGVEPDVAGHLRSLVSPDCRVTLCAVDGATSSDLDRQLSRVPRHATHVALSVGGNDALMNRDLLELPCRSTATALDLFRERVEQFEESYGRALAAVVALARRTTVCTIYNGNLPEAEAKRARVALMMFNDVILRQAFQRGSNVVDLRLVCTEASDYANAIEPSGAGGLKIARALVRALSITGKPSRSTVVTAG